MIRLKSHIELLLHTFNINLKHFTSKVTTSHKKPCNRNSYGVFAFSKDLLENRSFQQIFQQKTSGAFLLQCCNDEFGNIGIVLQQLIGKICLISGCIICFGLPFLKEIFVHLLCKTVMPVQSENGWEVVMQL